MIEALARMAKGKGCTATQLAIAWVLAKGEFIVPLIGARRRAQLDEALGALRVKLSGDEIASLEAAISGGAVVGTRYPPQVMTTLDSER